MLTLKKISCIFNLTIGLLLIIFWRCSMFTVKKLDEVKFACHVDQNC